MPDSYDAEAAFLPPEVLKLINEGKFDEIIGENTLEVKKHGPTPKKDGFPSKSFRSPEAQRMHDQITGEKQ